MSAVFSLFSANATTATIGTNFTNSSSFAMSDMLMINDEWKHLAQQLLYEGNGTAVIDVFCNAWLDDGTSSAGMTQAHTAIWNHAMTKTMGWAMIMLLKTILLEQRFDRWSGAHHRVWNIGSTLVPFAMAMWTIGSAILETSSSNKEEPVSKTDALWILGTKVASTPAVRNWIVTGLAWSLLYKMAFHRIRSSKLLNAIESIPGILSGILSLACWTFGETNVAAMVLGEGQEQLHPNTLLLYGKLLQWASNAIAGWYCYAWIVKRIFGTRRFTSFPCFLLAVVAGRIAMSGHVL